MNACRVCSRQTQGGAYCYLHKPSARPEVTAEHVRVARIFLGRGESLGDVAVRLDVMRSDLDLALWRFIDEPMGRRPAPMFA